MSKWYDEDPSLAERRATAPDVPRRHRAKKDRRRWCRGKVGVEHVLEVRLGRYAAYRRARDPKASVCYRAEWWPDYWSCSHERYCVNCGKILTPWLGKDCPNFTEVVTMFRRKKEEQ